ncbi:50S ribosomal protein L22 [Candidatus Hecatella orcuttiae]|jgi:large subunit ribosomal protein L22|uniref:50S ribosomal protein L22 n=1 Tax=Candidatus Hecatella orcuttiae TaxID=1935119 RepID=UPI002867B893|nr:50S ribosomal protein L22 [Candidatus Hecatella orcuttiae]
MPSWGYSIKELDKAKTAIASGRDLRISPKAAREICASIRKMRLEHAKKFLEEVIQGKRAVPYKRHKKEVPHRRGLQGWHAGRYPQKASRELLRVLKALEANAVEKGLDPERLRIVHAAAQRAMKIRKYIPRAFGRSSPYFQQLTHVEFAAAEI